MNTVHCTVEPHESKSVYVSSSEITGAGEGLFAKRTFLPGELVSYFNGVRVLESQMYRDNMTEGSLRITTQIPGDVAEV